jgi:general secretion pathway protein L
MVAPLQIMGKKLSVVDLQIKTKKEEVKKAEAVKKEVDTLSGEIVAINSLKSGRPMTIDILKELTAVLPKTAWLTRVRITEATVEIEGFADSATALLPKLESSKYFDKVEFASPTFRDVRMNADRFIIKMGIEDSNQNKGALSDEKG